MDLVELADRLWRGEDPDHASAPLGPGGPLGEVADGVAFLPNFANCSIVDTGDGLVMVDTGSILTAERVFEEVRAWRGARLRRAVFSHGHIDHVFGVGPFDEESAERGWPRPTVVAHAHLPRRFERYILTAGYNAVINRRQFGVDTLEWPLEYRFPDETYAETLTLRVGDDLFELRHEKGETDDATVTWLPGRRVLFSGDLFIWNSPNAGNPQKVQRYPKEWAEALRRMAALDAEVLLPGHGLPVVGAARVGQALTETAEYLEHLVDATLEVMNAGGRLDDALHSVRPPAHLASRPYLQPYYDEPEFIVRNVWRLYGGWWDGNPAHLRPAPERRLAAELCALAGGPGALAERASALVEEGGEAADRLAGHLAETAWLAAPEDPGIADARRRVFTALAERATSTMSRGVFRHAAREAGRGAERSGAALETD